MKKQRGLGLIRILLIVGALVITAGGVVVWEKKVTPSPTPFITPAQRPTPTQLPKMPPTSASSYKTSIPTLIYQKSGGCGNIVVYKINESETEGISVEADKDKVNLSTKPKTFDIATTAGLVVQIFLGENLRESMKATSFCNDFVSPIVPEPAVWTAKTGRATINISKSNDSAPVWERGYTATVKLKNVRFYDESGVNSVVLDELIFENISVGWLPG